MLKQVIIWLAIFGQPFYACCGGVCSETGSKKPARKTSCCGTSDASSAKPKQCCCGQTGVTCEAVQCLCCGSHEAPKVPPKLDPAWPDSLYPLLVGIDAASYTAPPVPFAYDTVPIPFKSHALRQALHCVWLK